MPMSPANDNCSGIGGEQLLHAAPRYFGKPGFSVASRARENAEAAFLHGRREYFGS